MKKTGALLLLFILLFAACARAPEDTFAPVRDFAAAFRLDGGEIPIAGTLRVYAYDDMRMTFTSPEALTPCTLVLTPDGCKMDVGGMSDETAAWELPEDAPVLLIGEALRAAIFTKQSFTQDKNGDYAVRLSLSGGGAAVTFSPDGLLREIRTDAGLTVCFTSAT